MVLVSQDGIQRPPLHFPKGGHLLQFLTCLETGLLPHGQLDPPLWNQRGKVSTIMKYYYRVSEFQHLSITSFVLTVLLHQTLFSVCCAQPELQWTFHLQGKVFPKLRKRSPQGSCDSVSDKEDDEATDYVFRILFPGNQMEFSECLQSACSASLR